MGIGQGEVPVRVLLAIALVTAAGLGRAAGLSVPSQFCSGDPCVITSPKDADPNIVLDFGNRAVVLQNTLTIKDLPSDAVGSLTIKARSFTINGAGQIRGFSTNAPGGAVTIEATTTIDLNGTVGSGAVRLSGQDAGALTLIAQAGPVHIAGKLALNGEGLVGSAGSLDIQSGSTITITGEIDMHGGLQGAGGDLDLTAPGDIVVSGFVDMSGGDVGGGFLDVTGGASFTLGPLDMSGSGLGGDAGFAIVDVDGTVRLQGEFRARGADNGEDCGDGADVDLTAGGDIFIQAEMDLRGRGTDCSGGSLGLFGSSVFIQSDVAMSGTGTFGSGGDVDATATNLFRLSATVELDGGESGGGSFFVGSDRDIEILGGVYAIGRSASSPGSAAFDLLGTKITISGTIDASAGSSAAPGTAMSLVACDVIMNPSAVVRALGDLGSIDVIANDTMMLRGQLQASANGGIHLRYGPAANPPDTAGTSFSPLPTSTLDVTLLPCRVCASNSDCADGNPCTDDVCDVTECLNPPLGNIPCEDGDECSVGDFCADGICVSGPVGTCNDLDQDGKPDAEDECTTLVWTAPPTTRPDQNPRRFVGNFKRLSAPDGQQNLLLKGTFNVAPSQPLLIDPAANGLHIYAEDGNGPIYDVSLPGGSTGCAPADGWVTLGIGFKKVWIYTNESGALPPACTPGSARGITMVQIKDKRIRPTGGLQLKLKGKAGSMLSDPTVPLQRIQVSIGLAAQTTPGLATAQAKAGQCLEALFTGNPIPTDTKPFCRAKVKQGTLDGVSCKGR